MPENELQNVIYFSPNPGFALAMAAGPKGITSIKGGKISFENAADFESDGVVYLYQIDSATVSLNLLAKIDSDQYALDMDEIVSEQIEIHRADEVFEHYELEQWTHPNDRK